MYCQNCGRQLAENSSFCPSCGRALKREILQASQPAQYGGMRGFSTRIADPAFAQYVKSSNRYSAIFTLILAVVAVVGFYIYGEKSSEMDNPGALYIGLGIGGMFLLIALFQILGRKRSKTWDGTVEDKKIKKKTSQHNYGDGDVRTEDYLEYSVIIRSDAGKKHVLTWTNTDVLYNYYNVGDRVRHHSGLKSYEKYDKSADKFIPCNACGTICDIRDDHCFRCKCPLLK
ncbi:MAG: zinc ribbon domain-containing protein [Clostridiaceae bacterium]|nr:zinc ribbon domain-containing protein [Clostridiaceae bacterium]